MDELNGPPDPVVGPPGAHGSIDVTPAEAVTRVRIGGEIDATIKDELSDALELAARRGLPVEVDCAQVQFMDSTGLSCLAWLANLTPEPPRLLDVPPTMRELLRLTGMDSAFAFGERETLG